MFRDALCPRRLRRRKAVAECNRASSSILQVLVEDPETKVLEVLHSGEEPSATKLCFEPASSRWRLQKFSSLQFAINLMFDHVEHNIAQFSCSTRRNHFFVQAVQALGKHFTRGTQG